MHNNNISFEKSYSQDNFILIILTNRLWLIFKTLNSYLLFKDC